MFIFLVPIQSPFIGIAFVMLTRRCTDGPYSNTYCLLNVSLPATYHADRAEYLASLPYQFYTDYMGVTQGGAVLTFSN